MDNVIAQMPDQNWAALAREILPVAAYFALAWLLRLSRRRWWLFLEEFAEKFLDFSPRCRQGLPAGQRGPVKFPIPSAFAVRFGYKQSPLFEGMEQRIHRAGAEFVAVAPKFLNHPQTKNVAVAGMVENVEADQSAIEILVTRVVVLHLGPNVLPLRHHLAPGEAVRQSARSQVTER